MFTTLGEMVDPKHAALIVVDVQNDFCHPEGVLAKQGRDISLIREMVPRLLSFVDQARRVNLPIIFIKVSHSRWEDSPVWLSKKRSLEKLVCSEGSWGAEFYKVSPREADHIVAKHRFNAFIGTDLDLVLRSMGIKTLIMTGVATNVCVESTARDGYQRDYYIVFLDDCTATYSLEEHKATLFNIDQYFGTVATSDQVVKAWQGS